MELIRGLHNLAARHRGCAATIGNFDGVHRGHQAVVTQLADKARALGLPTLLVLFEPQPQEFLRPRAAPARLMRLREKMLALRSLPVDRVLCVRFDARLAALAPEEFIETILVNGVGVRYLVVGDDFRFGRQRLGDFALLQVAGRRHHFELAATATFMLDGERVSSTGVRAALARADFAAAEKMSGRRYAIDGRVVHGDKIGRTLGIPTANVALQRRTPPVAGIFTVEVSGLGATPLPGVASVGTRPTVGGIQMRLEVYLLDFNEDIYGRHVSVAFLHKLRDELRFDSLSGMKQRIEEDIAQARAFFKARHDAPPAVQSMM